MAGKNRIVTENYRDGVTVVHFLDKSIMDEQNIQQIGKELYALVDKEKKTKIILDFGEVECLSAMALGKLIVFNGRIERAGGKLVICELADGGSGDVWHMFMVTKFNRIFAGCFRRDPQKPGATLVEAMKIFAS